MRCVVMAYPSYALLTALAIAGTLVLALVGLWATAAACVLVRNAVRARRDAAWYRDDA